MGAVARRLGFGLLISSVLGVQAPIFLGPATTPWDGATVRAIGSWRQGEGGLRQGGGAKARLAEAYARLPLSFEPGGGPPGQGVRFVSRGSGYELSVAPSEAVLSLHGDVSSPTRSAPGPLQDAPDRRGQALIRTRFLGAAPAPAIEASEALSGTVNHFIGNDPARWRVNVPTYARVTYRELWPGIDLTYYGRQGQLEYDFNVAPGADPDAIRMRLFGARDLSLDGRGDLVLATPAGDVRQLRPRLYQRVDGTPVPVHGSFVLAGNGAAGARAKGEVAFRVGPYDRSLPLVIDPALVYSTYLGGTENDLGDVIAVDSAGSAYLAGVARSSDFPTQNALQPSKNSKWDGFVTKFTPDGSGLVYSTYLGGNHYDEGYGIAVDSSGNAYVTGYTDSTDFPTVNPFQPTFKGIHEAYVTKISPDGSSLLYSSYLGGSDADFGRPIAVDSSGVAYVGGYSLSTDFPTVNALRGSNAGANDAFLSAVAADGSSLVYSTYLGGTGNDYGRGVAVDSGGNAYVAGYTRSTDFPTAGAFQGSNGGMWDAFVTKITADGSGLVYATYLGGARSDYGRAITVDSAGDAYVTGSADSTDFPMMNALQGTRKAKGDAFVTEVAASGSSLVYSTYLGGNGSDSGRWIAVDSMGNAYVAGSTLSTNFPTVDAFQGSNGGGTDVFVTEVSALGTVLVYSSYLGGNGQDSPRGIALDPSGNAYVSGVTRSTDFPTVNPFQATNKGSPEAFVAEVAAVPPAARPGSQAR